jgi:hypothetical protein
MIECRQCEAELVHHWLCNLPACMTLRRRVNVAKMRWRIERNYQELK